MREIRNPAQRRHVAAFFTIKSPLLRCRASLGDASSTCLSDSLAVYNILITRTSSSNALSFVCAATGACVRKWTRSPCAILGPIALLVEVRRHLGDREADIAQLL